LGTVSVNTTVAFPVAGGSVAPYAGSYQAHLNTAGVSAATLGAAMGVSEATLEAANQGFNATNGSMISQTVHAVAGEYFNFRWNFVEQDYLPFDDWAFYGISLNGAPAAVSKFASLGSVGPGNGSTINVWEPLTVSITQTGDYTFFFGIVNVQDTALNSDLFIDGADVGSTPISPPVSPIPEPGNVVLLGLLMGGGACLRSRRR
jgi:L-aminopeptidase/D-esterase-like protein